MSSLLAQDIQTSLEYDDNMTCCTEDSRESLKFFDDVNIDDFHMKSNSPDYKMFASTTVTPEKMYIVPRSPNTVISKLVSFPNVDPMPLKHNHEQETFHLQPTILSNASPCQPRISHYFHHQSGLLKPRIQALDLSGVFDTTNIMAKDDMKILSQFANEKLGEFGVEDFVGNQDSEEVYSKPTFLGEDFKPGKWDVICGRGKSSYDHIGNRRLRILVAMKLPAYVQSSKRGVKTAVVNDIVQQFQEASAKSGGFVRKDATHQKGVFHWYSIGEMAARERVGHAIRDCLTEPLRTRSKDKLTPTYRHSSLCRAQQELVESSLKSLTVPRKRPPYKKTRSASMLPSTQQHYGGFGLPMPPPLKRRRTSM